MVRRPVAQERPEHVTLGDTARMEAKTLTLSLIVTLTLTLGDTARKQAIVKERDEALQKVPSKATMLRRHRHFQRNPRRASR